MHAARSRGIRNIGGAKRDRTADLLHAMQALSQLSYGPEPWDFPCRRGEAPGAGSGLIRPIVFNPQAPS